MKTHTIEISEAQLRLIRTACLYTLRKNEDLVEGNLVEGDREEIDLIATLIDIVLEDEHEEDTIHGFCY